MATNVTRKELVNKVLRRLREDELTASQSISSTPYATMVGEFINDVKEEVEDSWNWGQLRAELDFNTATTKAKYNLGDTNADNSSHNTIAADGVLTPVTPTGYSRTNSSNERTQILGVYNNTQQSELRNMSDKYFSRVTYLGTQQNSLPSYYRSKGYDNNGDMIIEVYPVPDKVYAITCWVYAPQEPLTTDTSILALSCAETAIIYGSWAKCISERGEDGGQLFDEVTKKYNDYLSTAIARDRAHYDSADEGAEGDWVVT